MGIKISTGTISNLSFDFLLLIKQIHERNIGRLKDRFIQNGGMIIHVDATDENGGNAIFQIKEEKTGITLFADSMISEREEYIIPIFQKFKELFDDPIAIVRDMGAAVVSSSDKVFPNVPKQICHYHFIRALGKKLFDNTYSDFRTAIIKSKIVTDLYYIRKKTKEKLKESSVIFYERHAVYWLHLLIDHLLYPIKRIMDYPFQLSYKEFYDRITEIHRVILDQGIRSGGSIIKIHQFSSLVECIQSFVKNRKIQELANKVDILWDWFMDIRSTMRLMRNELREPKVLGLEEVIEMKEGLTKLLGRIQDEGKILGDVFLCKSKIIKKDFQDKWDGLFIDLRDNNGNFIPVHQDNNIDEQAHRWIRMGIRRRTGKSRTQMEMFQLGALLAYFSNLYNREYRDIVLDGVDNLVEEFGKLDWNQLPKERRRLFLRNDGLDIPIRDRTRKDLILDYVKNVVEDGPANDEYLNQWLSKMSELIECWDINFIDVGSSIEPCNPTKF